MKCKCLCINDKQTSIHKSPNTIHKKQNNIKTNFILLLRVKITQEIWVKKEFFSMNIGDQP